MDMVETISPFFSNMPQFVKNLDLLSNQKKIEVDLTPFSTDGATWDGTLNIKIINLTTEQVINYIISWAIPAADEISMNNDTLRLWWD